MSNAAVLSRPRLKLDYSLTGPNSTLAVEKGLAEADWYQCQCPAKPCASYLSAGMDPPFGIHSMVCVDLRCWYCHLCALGLVVGDHS